MLQMHFSLCTNYITLYYNKGFTKNFIQVDKIRFFCLIIYCFASILAIILRANTEKNDCIPTSRKIKEELICYRLPDPPAPLPSPTHPPSIFTLLLGNLCIINGPKWYSWPFYWTKKYMHMNVIVVRVASIFKRFQILGRSFPFCCQKSLCRMEYAFNLDTASLPTSSKVVHLPLQHVFLHHWWEIQSSYN